MKFKNFKSENPAWDYLQLSKNGERAKHEFCKNTVSRKGDLQSNEKIVLDTKKVKRLPLSENPNKCSAGFCSVRFYV